MNWVSFTLSIGMLGIFLPFTIYLQSALGFSALKAGLTLAPSSLVMIAVAPFLGRLTDKTGGKYILMSGLSLFAIGMGWAVLIAGPHSTWQDFFGPMIVAGLGMGGTFAPLTTVAMREVEPRMAGAASGMLNTAHQGYVLAMRWTMVMPIAVVALAAASCLAIKNKASGQDPTAASGADRSQMAGTMSSPGSSGSVDQSPGSSSGTAS